MPDNPGDDTPGAVWSASPHANRRSVPRYRFMARAIVTELSSGTRLPARTSELGLNGCYIDTLELFPVGTLVHLRILKDNGVFETSGRVLYCHLGIGMGIVFVDSTPDQRGVLAGWVGELAAQCEPTS